jgi:hypothetical protein
LHIIPDVLAAYKWVVRKEGWVQDRKTKKPWDVRKCELKKYIKYDIVQTEVCDE